MQRSIRQIAVITCFTLGLGILATPAQALTLTQDQDHREQHPDYTKNNPDYTKNSYYKIGNREGYQDHQHNTQRTTHNHNYRNDDDRKAHDYGYQQGLQGQSYRNQHPDPR